ncbi:MAG: ribosomal RNA small subunit methyltransferase A [Bacteroidales bacterium]|nr:ribosomal RNA small subunit methyltransferase A [Bacteroidales bacterium]
MVYVRPKKHLGQHFLTDANIARKIAASVPEVSSLPLLEIGPGKGILTEYLLDAFGKNFYAVEIDPEAAAVLKERFPELGERLITGDFLTLPLEELFPHQVGLAGNLPYNISSQIFFRLLDHYSRIPFMVCMVQKEVAERIASPGGNKDYGILSVLLQAYYTVEYLFTVNEKVFSPPPKVKSAVIRLIRKETLPGCDFGKLKNLVKAAFNQRRKMLRNSLSAYPELLENFPSVAELRPENLSVEDFISLAQAL